MLRRFVYLNEEQLDQYIAQVEEGLLSGRSRTHSQERGVEGGGDLKIAKASGSRSSGETETSEFTDSGPARFGRLVELVRGHEDDFRWVEVLQEADLEAATRGDIVSLAVDLYESDITKLTGPNGALGKLPLMNKMQQNFSSWATAAAGLPGAGQPEAMSAFASSMPDMIMFGDFEDSDWRVMFTLPALTDIEGETQLVGKVTRVVAAGHHEPLPGIPIIDQLPRQQRRAFVQAGPQPGQEMMWAAGPLLIIEPLALFR